MNPTGPTCYTGSPGLHPSQDAAIPAWSEPRLSSSAQTKENCLSSVNRMEMISSCSGDGMKGSVKRKNQPKSNCLTLLYGYGSVSICSCRFTSARLSRSAHQTYNAKLLNTSNKGGFLHSKSRSVKQESCVEVLNRKELGFGMINHDESMINIYSMQHPLPLQMYHLTPPVLTCWPTNRKKKPWASTLVDWRLAISSWANPRCSMLCAFGLRKWSHIPSTKKTLKNTSSHHVYI